VRRKLAGRGVKYWLTTLRIAVNAKQAMARNTIFLFIYIRSLRIRSASPTASHKSGEALVALT
jgi:hypothetical protein